MEHIQLSAHALERLTERAPGLPSAAALKTVAEAYPNAVEMHQPPDRGPDTFRVVAITPQVYALCAAPGITVYTVLTSEQVARSVATGAWYTKRVRIEGDSVPARDTLMLMWEQDGTKRIHIAPSSHEARKKVQALVDAGVDTATVRCWTESSVHIGVRKVVTLEIG